MGPACLFLTSILSLVQYVKEGDLLGHFRTFGRVVELQLIVTDPAAAAATAAAPAAAAADSKGEEESGGKRSYNECLVQFGGPAEAKKCFNSPTAVLNNRFIKVRALFVGNGVVTPVFI